MTKDEALKKIREIEAHLQSENLSWETYETLNKIVYTQPELADKVFDIVRTDLQIRNNDNSIFEKVYATLGEIVRAKSELADDVFQLIQQNVSAENHSQYSLMKASDALTVIVKAKPELADKVFDTLKVISQSDKNSWDLCREEMINLDAIMEEHPEFGKLLFDTFKSSLQTDDNTGYLQRFSYYALGKAVQSQPKLADKVLNSIYIFSLTEKDGVNLTAYQTLQKIAVVRPKLIDEVLDEFKYSLSSEKIKLFKGYENLSEIIVQKPELADKVFDTFKVIVQSNKNNWETIKLAYSCLGKIIINRPELADKTFDIFKTVLKSEQNISYSLEEAYWVLGKIVAEKPELADKALDIFNITLQSKENNWSSYRCAYSRLDVMLEDQPGLADKVFGIYISGLLSDRSDGLTFGESCSQFLYTIQENAALSDVMFNTFKERLQSGKNDSLSLQHTYYILEGFILNGIIYDKPELSRHILDTVLVAMQSENNDQNLLHRAYDIIGNIITDQPESINQVFDTFNHILKLGKQTSVSLDVLSRIVKDYPEQADDIIGNIITDQPESINQVFDTFNHILKSGKQTSVSLDRACYVLSRIVKDYPEQAENMLNTIRIGFKSDKNTGDSMKTTYETLGKMMADNPQLADKILDTFKVGLMSENNKFFSLQRAYEILSLNFYKSETDILRENPKLIDKVLDNIQIGVKSENNNPYSLRVAYASLAEIVNKLPQEGCTEFDAHKFLDVYKTALKSEHNDELSLKIAYDSLNKFVRANPEVADKVLDVLKIGMQSDKNDIDSIEKAYEVLGEIVSYRPELADKVLDTIQPTLSDDYFFEHSLTLRTLGVIAKANPKVANKVLDISLNLDFDPPDDIYKAIVPCMKHVPLEKTLARYPDWDEELRLAHKFRFSSDDEVKYALENFSTEKLLRSTIISAQHRAMNVLVGFAFEEVGIDKNEQKWFRTSDVSQEAAYFLLDNHDWLLPTSFNAAGVMGCYFPSFIKAVKKAGLSVSDVENLIPKPMSAEKNYSFTHFMLKNLQYQNAEHQMVTRPIKELQIIARNWSSLKPEEEKGRYQDVLAVCLSKKYENQRDDKFAVEAASHAIPESEYHNAEEFYLAGLGVPVPFDTGVEFKDKTGKYVARFLPRDDVRVGFFGEYTNCCQKFGGIGHACAVSTVKHPFSQLFVIEKEHEKEEDKNKPREIIAGSWIWENTEGTHREVCFDNIETIGNYSNKRLEDLAIEKENLVRAVTEQLMEESLDGKYKSGDQLWKDYLNAIELLDEIPDKQLYLYEADIKKFESAEQKLSKYMKKFENDDERTFVIQWNRLKETQKEHLNCRRRVALINDIYEQVGQYLAEEQNCRCVTIGVGYQDAKIGYYEDTEPIALPSLYGTDGTNSYTDARSQVLLAENPNAKPLDKTKECPCYVRRICFTDIDKIDDICEKSFPNGDQELADVENRAGFVVEDPHRGVVGYVIYDEQEKYIADMAVLEEYRTRKMEGKEPKSGGYPIDKSASNKLMFAMFEEIERIGGQWSAHMRDRTSFKLLKFMEKRGQVKIVGEPTLERVMSDGSKVYDVTFHPIHKEAQKLHDLLHSKKENDDAKDIVATKQKRNSDIHTNNPHDGR